jgi:hypothetical protein
MAAPSDLFPVFSTMRAIGMDIDMTSHQVGKALTDAGYRTPDGSPSQRAFQEHLVEPYTIDANGRKAYRWRESFVKLIAKNWANKNLAPATGSKVPSA